MQYTRKQLTKLRNLLEEDDKKRNNIQNALALFSESSYTPVIDFYCLMDVIVILDDKLSNVASYILYECKNMKDGGSITHKDSPITHKLSGDLKGFLKYCKLEDLILKE